MPDSWILKGGMIYDGSGAVGYKGDVRIASGRITHVAKQIPDLGENILDVSGLIVCPGLIDLHVHVYDGMGVHSITPEEAGLRTGVTTMLDTGSAGALNYPTFEKYLIKPAKETIYALLNISHFGAQGHPDIPPYVGDLHHEPYLDPAPAFRCIAKHSEHIVGVKARLTTSLTGGRPKSEMTALNNALHVSRELGLPCYIHHVMSSIPQDQLLASLTAGDVLTHFYHAMGDGGFTGKNHAPSAAMLDARERGVIFDVGHGSGCFAWEIAEAAVGEHGFLPDTISTDIHRFNIKTPVIDLPTTMSKFLHLGMSLEKVIQRVTANPATMLRRQNEHGSLMPGRRADITILKRVKGKHELEDSMGIRRVAKERLVPVCVFKNGLHHNCHTDAHDPIESPVSASE